MGRSGRLWLGLLLVLVLSPADRVFSQEASFAQFWKVFQSTLKTGDLDKIRALCQFPFLDGRQNCCESSSPAEFGQKERCGSHFLLTPAMRTRIQSVKAARFHQTKKTNDFFIDPTDSIDLAPHLPNGTVLYKATMNKDFPQLDLYFARVDGQFKLVCAWRWDGE